MLTPASTSPGSCNTCLPSPRPLPVPTGQLCSYSRFSQVEAALHREGAQRTYSVFLAHAIPLRGILENWGGNLVSQSGFIICRGHSKPRVLNDTYVLIGWNKYAALPTQCLLTGWSSHASIEQVEDFLKEQREAKVLSKRVAKVCHHNGHVVFSQFSR